ncbi:NXPE family member 3-like [Mizuhopecten yessoensis]|uniref:NXPE family member 3 n=1 Tax=Mizuhopecten yessoensis TaxID=6573 RepID=A0A210R3U2_MIZYE|nr:NXPE family member 3-like [Mizuhopecten yessoensis]OWF55669.1 NXPE family member 3 [Mizuhopecten yessoensis]
MAVNASPFFRRMMIWCVLTTIICFFFTTMDTTKWFDNSQLRGQIIYEFASWRTIPMNALEKMNEYLKLTDFKDFISLANITTSVINTRKDISYVRVGDEIRVDIVLYNGRGERFTVGGDMLRVWLREHSLRASVSGHVIDHDNGSYTGIVKVLWVGNPELMISIANTKEHIGIYLNNVHTYGLITFLKAGFERNKLTESTLCSVVPNIPDVKEYCNFTAQNFNMSFFCGKPINLSCSDWSVYERTDIHSCYKKHQSLFLQHKNFKKRVSTLNVYSGFNFIKGSHVSCHDLNSTVTWQTNNPTGYFYKGQWRSLVCRPSLRWRYESYLKCLKNRPVLMTGDSTTRNWFSPLAKLLNLHILVGNREIKDKAWQKFSEAVDNDTAISMYWTPHEIPFYSHEQNKNNFRSVASRIDELPGNKSAIVVLHWYGHLTRTTPEQYREHVQSAKKAVVRLLRRSPHSSIFIKGPHSYTYGIFLEPFDYLSRIFEQILYEEFKDLQHKVYYIDQWDATVGNENVHIHPTFPSFYQIMINFVFSFICKI